ncbi:MAG TPA: HAD family hydrolase [Bryobacteraceae bacterium]|nr:HAD family hydrolase [Bryobacteraceae bacterium]
MRYLALASDYDGTLAHDGVVDSPTIRALERLIHSGRQLILVTGRELADLTSVFSRIELCERVVAENGAVLYHPATGEKHLLAACPPPSFIEDLRRRGVPGISCGEAIISTWRPHETQVLEAIRESGLKLQVILNKESVMVLPSGVDKKTGLRAALQELQISHHNLAGIGDAENDHAFLESCGCSAAVANAIPALKEKVDFVTQGERGAGVVEFIDRLIANDLSGLSEHPRS